MLITSFTLNMGSIQVRWVYDSKINGSSSFDICHSTESFSMSIYSNESR
jgi:hypothetical protein